MQTYKSRISWVIVAIVALICFGIPLATINDPKIGGDVICIAVFVIIMLALNSIKYVIDGKTLKVYYFYGIHQDIDINTIKKMEPSRCLLSSPAASFKRLAIYYNKYDVVYISPRNQEDFIKQINDIHIRDSSCHAEK